MKRAYNYNLLETFIKKRKLNWEKERIKFLKQAIQSLDVLSRKYDFREAYIFGSIIKANKFLPTSDIDIAIVKSKN